jgi:hypothetical protein
LCDNNLEKYAIFKFCGKKVYNNMATVQYKGRDLSFGLAAVIDETLSLHGSTAFWTLAAFSLS